MCCPHARLAFGRLESDGADEDGLFLKREAWFADAVAIWDANRAGRIQCCVLASNIDTLAYLVRKNKAEATSTIRAEGRIAAAGRGMRALDTPFLPVHAGCFSRPFRACLKSVAGSFFTTA
jgi:hypothetical protein